jgi:hypothetical protein
MGKSSELMSRHNPGSRVPLMSDGSGGCVQAGFNRESNSLYIGEPIRHNE